MVKVIKACERRLNYLIKMKPPRKAKNNDHLDLENTDEVKQVNLQTKKGRNKQNIIEKAQVALDQQIEQNEEDVEGDKQKWEIHK